MITLVTPISHSFMLGLFVLRQIAVVTLVTPILYAFVQGLLVYDQTTLCSSFVVTPVTAIPHSLMTAQLI